MTERINLLSKEILRKRAFGMNAAKKNKKKYIFAIGRRRRK